MTAEDVLRRVSAHELYDWQRFAAFHPFPADLLDLHGARQTWLLAMVNRAADVPPFELQEFRLMREPTPAPAAKPVHRGAPMLDADRMMLALEGTENGR
jgi:hypothetical protein